MEHIHYLERLEDSVKENWNRLALSDIDGDNSYSYGEMANAMAQMRGAFKAIGLKEGDKVAICGRNCSRWAIAFLSVVSYKAVAVSILPDFTGDNIHNLVNHSEAKLLFVGPNVKNKIDPAAMPALKGVVFMDDNKMYAADSPATAEAFEKAIGGYKPIVTKENVSFVQPSPDSLALINYTSGTTNAPKGVMLTHNNLSANITFSCVRIPHKKGDRSISMLPIAHMFGLMFEFLYQVCDGAHVNFLTKTPTPATLMSALSTVRPFMILTVPMVIEKIMRKNVFPTIKKPLMRVLWYTPVVGSLIRKKVREKLLASFGGRLRYLIIGGAALNKEVERCLKQINFPYCVGYGMTECGPLIAYEDWWNFRYHSCGRCVFSLKMRIVKGHPDDKDGEVQVKGDNVMLGYYKNQDATDAVFTNDGWLRTGDLGRLDKRGNLMLRGRSKNMILRPDGQNIYPEEIEDKLNNMPHVVESVVVDRAGKLVGLVYPEPNVGGIDRVMEQNLASLNRILPQFCRLSSIELVEKEFEKTPKRSIKRFLYS